MLAQIGCEANVDEIGTRYLPQHGFCQPGVEAAAKIADDLAGEARNPTVDLAARQPDAEPVHWREPVILAKRTRALRCVRARRLETSRRSNLQPRHSLREPCFRP